MFALDIEGQSGSVMESKEDILLGFRMFFLLHTLLCQHFPLHYSIDAYRSCEQISHTGVKCFTDQTEVANHCLCWFTNAYSAAVQHRNYSNAAVRSEVQQLQADPTWRRLLSWCSNNLLACLMVLRSVRFDRLFGPCSFAVMARLS